MTGERAMLLIGHPGHELRLHHWLELERPTVCVLTDGSGGTAQGRIEYSRDCVARAGATTGPLFGHMADRDWYAALLARDPAPFVEAGDKIACAALTLGIGLIVSDARDGYNPMHDAACCLATMVVEGLSAQGQSVRRLTAPATGEALSAPVRELWLDSIARKRKEAAMARYAPLLQEIEQAREQGLDIGVERLYPDDAERSGKRSPAYEAYGSARVADGDYRSVIMAEAHYQPLMAEVRSRLFDLWGLSSVPERSAVV